ncbi:MAG: M1 family metallopeptidase [Fidelibacterota bacterium]
MHSIKNSLVWGFFMMSLMMATDYFQQNIAYTIQVTLNDTNHTLQAHEKLTYTNHSPDTLNFIWFHLWPNAYKNDQTALERQLKKRYSTRMAYAKDDERGYIDSLNFTSDGVVLDWSYHPDWIDAAKVKLAAPLYPGESVTIETPFFVKIPKVFSRLGHTGQHYEITQWYPKPAVYDRNGWHVMPYLDQGEFYSEFGSYDVFITLPADYRIMATGDLVDGDAEYSWLDSLAKEGDALYELPEKELKKKLKTLRKAERSSDGLKTIHFHQIKVHDFAWFADWKWIVRKGELFLADSTRSVTLWSMYLPKNAELWEKSIEYIHDAGYWYSKFYGDYPYNHITAVDGDMSAGGGMEYPNITVISSSGSKDILEFVIMHEVGHNWFYGILGSDEREHPWMDEGLNEYSNFRYWNIKYHDRDGAIILSEKIQSKLGVGRGLQMHWAMGYARYSSIASVGYDQALNLYSEAYTPGNYGSMVYGKTALMMWFLQHYLGEETMNRAMQAYYEKWKFKHPAPEDFRAAFQAVTDKDLSWFWQDAMNSVKTIDYALKKEKDRYILVNKGTMSTPVEIAYYDKIGNELSRTWIPIKNQSIPLAVPITAARIVIDPDEYMPDIDRTNNATRRPLKFTFVFDQPDYYTTHVNWLPWLFAWNQYNGFTPGLMLYSGFIPGYRYGISILPMWDFNHSRLIGQTAVERTWYRVLFTDKLTFRGSYSDLASAAGWQIKATGEKTPSIFLHSKWIYTGEISSRLLRADGLDTTYYEAGHYRHAGLGVQYSNRPTMFTNYSSRFRVKLALHGADYAKWSWDNTLSHRWTKSIRSRVRSWVGGFIYSNDVPRQEQIYLSGGVDPDFASGYVLNRTGKETPYDLYDEQYTEDGPGLRGYVLASSINNAWGFNVIQDIPHLPVKLFMDVAGQGGSTYSDAGIMLGTQSLSIFIPVYQDWEKQAVATNTKEYLRRVRFSLSLSTFRIGF